MLTEDDYKFLSRSGVREVIPFEQFFEELASVDKTTTLNRICVDNGIDFIDKTDIQVLTALLEIKGFSVRPIVDHVITKRPR